ncbi:MAG: hypothetical protein RQ839_05155 [Thermoproteus sp.]|nr:hypothetical protein [Thermoproteus sp.]MDT7881539.1 hypothetical protein [Thermoproteus sp.]
MYIKAKSWRQKWSKDEAISLVADYLRRGEWMPMLTMWLGDGKARWRNILQSKYELLVATKEPWRLGIRKGAYEALVATGREAFVKLRGSAGAYGELLDLLRAHKWIVVMLATDNALRVAHNLKTEKRSIDILRETYSGHNNDEIPTLPHVEADKPGVVTVAGVAMYLKLIRGKDGSLYGKRRIKNLGHALAIAGRLESAGLRPNIVKDGSKYAVYITTSDLLKLAEKDEAIRRAIALYLAEKAKNGTPRQKEMAEKLLKRHPLFQSPNVFCFYIL